MIPDIGSIFSSIWNAPGQSDFFFWIKVVAGFVTAVLLIANILLLSKRIRTDVRTALYGVGAPRVKKSKYAPRWERIRNRLDEKSLASAKLALIEADKILDEVLGKLGYAGSDTVEKVSNIKTSQLVGIEGLREVQTLHRRIIDDHAHETDIEELRAAVLVYERVLKGLEII
jgi:hypothetical protein